MSPTRVEQYADPIACPDDLTFQEPFPRTAPEGVEPEPQACHGGTANNSRYGNGQVDAFDAVTHNTKNDPQPSPVPLP